MKNLLIVLLLCVISCSEIDTLKSSFDDSKINISLQNLNDPASGMYYEAWLKPSSGATVSLGLLGKEQNEFTLESTLSHELNFRGQIVFVTIERDDVPGMRFTQGGDTLFSPTNDIVICSVINGNEGAFSVANGFLASPGNVNAVTTEFLMENALATMRLFTPTQDDDNDLGGLWFVDLVIEDGDSTITPGLNIPAFRNGWMYESFIDISGQHISLGKFSNPQLADQSFAFSGPGRNEFTLFPGEDFLNNPPAGMNFPLDLSNGVVSVTLSPVFSDTLINTPFETVLFEGTIPAGYSAGQQVDLQPVLTNLPSGTAQIELDLYN